MTLVGPRANPARAGAEVVGVAEPARRSLIAGALANRGSVHALVVHGEPGMDEISPLGVTHVLEVREGQVREWVIDPAELRLPPVTADEIGGGDPVENATLIESLLAGEGSRGARAAVALNAAGALYVSESGLTFADAYQRSLEELSQGAGARALERLRNA